MSTSPPPPLVTRRSARLLGSTSSSTSSQEDQDDAGHAVSPTSPSSSSFAGAGVASTSALPLAPVVPTSVGAVVGLKRSLSVASVGEGVDESSTSHPALADTPSVVGKRLKAAAAAARTNKKNKKDLVLLGAKRARNNKNNSNNPAAGFGSGSASPSRFAFTFGSPTSSDSIDSLSPNIEYSGLHASLPADVLARRVARRKVWSVELARGQWEMLSVRSKEEMEERAREMFWEEMEEELGMCA